MRPTGAAAEVLIGGPTAVEFDVREAAGWDSAVIPPLILKLPWPEESILFGDHEAARPRLELEHQLAHLVGRGQRQSGAVGETARLANVVDRDQEKPERRTDDDRQHPTGGGESKAQL
jgi:hypothetical protein